MLFAWSDDNVIVEAVPVLVDTLLLINALPGVLSVSAFVAVRIWNGAEPISPVLVSEMDGAVIVAIDVSVIGPPALSWKVVPALD